MKYWQVKKMPVETIPDMTGEMNHEPTTKHKQKQSTKYHINLFIFLWKKNPFEQDQFLSSR